MLVDTLDSIKGSRNCMCPHRLSSTIDGVTHGLFKQTEPKPKHYKIIVQTSIVKQ